MICHDLTTHDTIATLHTRYNMWSYDMRYCSRISWLLNGIYDIHTVQSYQYTDESSFCLQVHWQKIPHGQFQPFKICPCLAVWDLLGCWDNCDYQTLHDLQSLCLGYCFEGKRVNESTKNNQPGANPWIYEQNKMRLTFLESTVTICNSVTLPACCVYVSFIPAFGLVGIHRWLGTWLALEVQRIWIQLIVP